jgi:hypothetical protein
MEHKHERLRKWVNAAAVAAVTMIAMAGCKSFGPKPVTPISNITSAASGGMNADSIVARIRNAKTTYALRGSDFAKLAAHDVPGPVLDELQQGFFARVETLTRRWYMRSDFGGRASIYPQPVDLDSLDNGGNGMAPFTADDRIAHGSRPPGVPDWVPAYPSLTGGVVSPDAVLQMTQSGQPAEEIVETVANARVWPMYIDTVSAFKLARFAAITGSVYADLARQGVAPEVLDALQATYLASHIELTRRSTPAP